MKRKTIKIICIAIATLIIGAVLGWVIVNSFNTTSVTQDASRSDQDHSVDHGNGSSLNDTKHPQNTDVTKGADSSAMQAPAMTADEAKQLAAKLTSQNMSEFSSVWVNGASPSVAPAGTTIVFDTNTFYSQETYGRIDGDITMPGQAAQTWRFLLEYIDGQWLVYTSEAV